MTRFRDTCQDYGLHISLKSKTNHKTKQNKQRNKQTNKKTQGTGQDVDCPPAISINDHELNVIHDFVYLGSAISDTLSLDSELNRRIGKAAITMSRLTKKAWNNSKLTVHTKIQIYRACVVSTLLYGSRSWTLRAEQCSMLFTCAASVPSEHCLAGQGPGKSWMYQHVHAAETETCTLAWLRRAHGRRSDPQRPPLWRTRAGKTSHWQTTAAIQRCVQEGPKSLEHRPEQLGSNSPQTVSLEADCGEKSLQLRRDPRSAARRKENETKGCRPCRQTSVRLREMVIPASDWPATPRAQLHSLLRFKDEYVSNIIIIMITLCVHVCVCMCVCVWCVCVCVC